MNARDFSNLSITVVETSIPNFGQDLVGKTLDHASSVVALRDLELLYEGRTSTLDSSQRELYEMVLSKVPKKLAIFLDPIIVSFALKDASDLSNVDYVWLDLEGGEDFGNSLWVKRGAEKEILRLMNDFLGNHLEKYVIDAYDRLTREDMTRIWEAQIDLKECPICGGSSFVRRFFKMNRQELRGWICSECEHHIILPSDTLDFFRNSRKPSEQENCLF